MRAYSKNNIWRYNPRETMDSFNIDPRLTLSSDAAHQSPHPKLTIHRLPLHLPNAVLVCQFNFFILNPWHMTSQTKSAHFDSTDHIYKIIQGWSSASIIVPVALFRISVLRFFFKILTSSFQNLHQLLSETNIRNHMLVLNLSESCIVESSWF